MKHTKLSAAALITTLIAATPALADRLDDMKARGILVCGTVPNFEPFSYPDPNTRQLVGYDVDFCEAIAKKLGVKYEMKTSSSDARIPTLNEGHVDILTANLGYTPARAEQINYTQQYYVSPHRIVVRSDKGLNDLDAMAGKRISFIKGSTTEGFVRASVKDPQMVNFDDAPTAFLALVQGKVDGFSASAIAGARLIDKSAGTVALKPIEKPVGTEKWGIGIKKGEDRLLKAVNDALSDLEKSGEAQRIHDKWLGADTMYKQTRIFKIEPINN